MSALNVAVKTVVLVVENRAYRPAVADDPAAVDGEIQAVVGKRVTRLIPVSIEFAAANA